MRKLRKYDNTSLMVQLLLCIFLSSPSFHKSQPMNVGFKALRLCSFVVIYYSSRTQDADLRWFSVFVWNNLQANASVEQRNQHVMPSRIIKKICG